MENTTAANTFFSDQHSQRFWPRASCGVQPVDFATGEPTKPEHDDHHRPCSVTLPDAVVSGIDSTPNATEADFATAPQYALPPEVCHAPPATAKFPDAATSDDGGQHCVHLSHTEGSSAEELEQTKDSEKGTGEVQVQLMSRRQSDVGSCSTSIDSENNTVNRCLSSSASMEASCPARSKHKNSELFHDRTDLRDKGSTCSNPGTPSKRSSRCSTDGTSEKNTRQIGKTRIDSCYSTASSTGKRYVVLSRPAGLWRQQLQPLRHDVCHVPCHDTHNFKTAVNFVQPKCDTKNTVYKVAPCVGSNSTSSSALPVQGLRPPATCNQCSHLDGVHVSGQTIEEVAAPSTGQLTAIAGAESRNEHNAAGEEVASEEITGSVSTIQRGAQVNSLSASEAPGWFTKPYPFSFAPKTKDQKAVPATAPSNTGLPVSLSYPQLTQHGGVSEQHSALEESTGGKEDIARKTSSYLNVSLNSLCDELTIISYNIQMLVDCCSLNVNWWSREKRFVQYVRKIAKERNADVIVFQECWSEESQRLIRSLAKGEDGVAFPFQTRVVGADSGPPHYWFAWGSCYCTMGECCRNCCPPYRDDQPVGCLCCRACCCCCCVPVSAAGRSKGGKAVQSHGHQEQQGPEKRETPTVWTSVSGAFSRLRRNGGVMIISKWPMLERHAYVYKRAVMPDCLENKGAVLVRVNKCGRIFNVVGTHLQSGDTNSRIRLAQLRELARWLRSGMEACEQEEFFSAEADNVPAPQAAPISEKAARRADAQREKARGRTAAAAAKSAEKGGGRGQAATGKGTAKTAAPAKGKRKKKRKGLPPDLIKPHEPLIVCGDLNTPFLEDRDILMEALRADCLNCRLCFSDLEHVPTSYDTVLNSTCAASKPRASTRRETAKKACYNRKPARCGSSRI